MISSIPAVELAAAAAARARVSIGTVATPLEAEPQRSNSKRRNSSFGALTSLIGHKQDPHALRSKYNTAGYKFIRELKEGTVPVVGKVRGERITDSQPADAAVLFHDNYCSVMILPEQCAIVVVVA